MSQRKYLTNLLKKTGILRFKPIETLMDPNTHIDQYSSWSRTRRVTCWS